MKLNDKQEIIFSCDRACFGAHSQLNDELNEDLRALSGPILAARGDDPIVGLFDTLSGTASLRSRE
jgi:hypothetical protein